VDLSDTDNQYILNPEDESSVDFDEIDNYHDLDDEEYINDEDIHNSEDEDNDDIHNDEVNMHDEIIENKRCTVEGTLISVSDLVYGCLFISAACAMQYNKKGLCHDKGTTYVAPLKELQLGTCLRVKPIPSPN
jgi:hypothetical protein